MKKREHTKTPFLLRLGCFSKIACIYKALHYQQRFQQFLLMILLLFAMLSVSISVSVFTRSDSIVARIDQMHATHTAIISDSPKGMYKFLDVIQKEEHCFDYYEKTSVFPYAPYPGSSIQGSFPLYIEGYVKSDANYPLLDGKPLEKLIGNEIAITQSYAKQLEDKGIQVLGHKEVIKDPSNGKTYSFVIASIMEYPNYNQGYIGQNDINKVDMFTIAKPAVAIGNYETIKKLEKASIYGNAMAKIRFHDYHEQDEYDLRSRMYLDYTYITGEMASYPDFRLLAEEMNANKIMNGIFQFVSLCVTICMLISSCFVLYAFMKRKLIKDQEKLSLMFMNGVRRLNIRNAYLLEIVQIFIQAFIIHLILLFMMQWFLHVLNRYDLLLLFTLSMKGWLLIIGSTLLFLAALLFQVTLQVRSCFKGNLVTAIRSRSLHLKHHKSIHYRYQSLQMALRDIVTTPFSSLRSVVSLAFVFVTLLVLSGTSTILFHLYTPETFGLSFDYMLKGPISFSSFTKLQKTYLDEDFVFVAAESADTSVYRCFMVDDRSNRDENLYHYYPGLLMIMDGPLDKFLPLRKGTYPQEANEQHLGERAFELQYGMTTRRLEHDFGLYTMQDKKVAQDDTLRTKTYVEYSLNHYLSASQLHGFTESIINNGYITFFRAKRRPLNTYWYPEIPTTLLRLKDEKQAATFETTCKQQGITYVRYKDILDVLQENNNALQARLFAIMAGVASLTILVGCMTMYANVQSDIEEKRREEGYLLKLGWQRNMQKKRLLLHEIILLVMAFLLGLLLYAVFKLPYFAILRDYLGLYTLPSAYSIMPWLMALLCAGGVLLLLVIGRHRGREI